MQKRLSLLILLTIMLQCTTWALAGQPLKTSAAGDTKSADTEHPRTVVPHMEYRFDPVFEGNQIKHDFVIENHGTAPLVIKSVRPG